MAIEANLAFGKRKKSPSIIFLYLTMIFYNKAMNLTGVLTAIIVSAFLGEMFFKKYTLYSCLKKAFSDMGAQKEIKSLVWEDIKKHRDDIRNRTKLSCRINDIKLYH